MKLSKQILIVFIVFLALNSISCRKFIEVDAPYTSFNGANVYTTDGTAISAVTAMYTDLGTAGGGLTGSIYSLTYYAALSADEVSLFPGNAAGLTAVYNNEITALVAPQFWQQLYSEIYFANSAIEGLTASTGLTPSIRNQLLGEAKFMRAFCYFYLINLYGEVPLVVSTNYKMNSLLARTASFEVWAKIINDLLDAKELLSSNYLGADVITSMPTTERVRPNKWTATALLARAYLYTKDFVNAEIQATEVINTTSLYGNGLSNSLLSTFLKDPVAVKEAIWQIQGVTTGWNTNDARTFVLPATGPNTGFNPFYLSKRFLQSFEPNDSRRTNWIKGIKVGADSFYYSNKYKSATLNAPVTEYLTVFRMAEQYLIRAEARAQQENLGAAKNDLNVVRNRAGLGNTTANTKEELINMIIEENRHEFFCEWGHRWFDLKRFNSVDSVMGIETSLKGGTWQSKDQFYPISLDEITANPNLKQTPGYE